MRAEEAAEPSKSALRERMRTALRGVSASEARAAGRAIASLLTESSFWSASDTIALYASLPTELETTSLIEAAWDASVRVLLPRVVGPGQLAFAEVRRDDALVPGAFGVREPAPANPVVELAEADRIFVPGLAFDRRGGRLGRGAGYYDRALAAVASAGERKTAADRDSSSPRTIGLAFERQLVASVPMDAWDVRLDAVATPTQVHVACDVG